MSLDVSNTMFILEGQDPDGNWRFACTCWDRGIMKAAIAYCTADDPSIPLRVRTQAVGVYDPPVRTLTVDEFLALPDQNSPPATSA